MLTLVCDSLDASNNCVNPQLIDAYLLPPDSAPMLELLLAGGYDSETVLLGFFAVISLFVTGLTVGLIISQVRKLRSP